MSATISERTVICEQGSGEWLQMRCGMVTSSRVAAAIAKRKRVKAGEKAEEMASRYKLRMELIGELLTGKSSEHFVSEWMEQGREREPLARSEYEMRQDVNVETVGFVYHGTISRAGSSPDGLIGSTGIVEFKCPKIETHLQYLIDDDIPEEYLPQMLWQLACDEGREWNDFVSYHPDLPEQYQVFRKRLERTQEVDAVIRGMESEVEQFLAELDAVMAQLKGLGG